MCSISKILESHHKRGWHPLKFSTDPVTIAILCQPCIFTPCPVNNDRINPSCWRFTTVYILSSGIRSPNIVVENNVWNIGGRGVTTSSTIKWERILQSSYPSHKNWYTYVIFNLAVPVMQIEYAKYANNFVRPAKDPLTIVAALYKNIKFVINLIHFVCILNRSLCPYLRCHEGALRLILLYWLLSNSLDDSNLWSSR